MGVAEANRKRRGVWTPPPKSEETRRKLAAARRGKPSPAVAEANRRRVWTPEQRAAISERSRNISPESRALQATKLRGRKLSPEAIRARYRPLPDELSVQIGDDQALRSRVLRRIRQYGNTLDEVTRFVAATARGVCDLCGNRESRKQKGQLTPLSFDHDHTTGRYRGALCSSCNLMLGHGRDRADILRRGADYLERTHR